MKKLFLALGFLYISLPLLAADMEIVEIKRNITLADDEPVYKDFYIQIDSNSSLKKNLVVTAMRTLNIKDNGLKSVGNIKAPVGLLKIIHIEGKIAVGREYKLEPRDNLPMLEQIGIMTGDSIDLSESFVDSSKPTAKRKTASVSPAASDSTATPSPAPVEATPSPAAPSLPLKVPLKSPIASPII